MAGGTHGPKLDPAISGYYAQGREQSRLETANRLEFLRTQELLARFLPPVPARVLDVGGGAGIHAVPLQRRGYDVHLLDPVELHVRQARAAGVRADLGDARRLDRADDSVDAVLLLGPLYHLVDGVDRLQALREAARVLVDGGVVIVAAISRFASTLDGLARGFLADPAFEAIVERDVAEGRHENPTSRPGWFTTAYFHRPEELAREVEAAGLQVLQLVAVEGPASLLGSDEERWLGDERQTEVLLRAIRRVETEPALLGASAHFVAVART